MLINRDIPKIVSSKLKTFINDCEVVKKEGSADIDTTCSICLGLVYEPLTCINCMNHLFCKQCVQNLNPMRCPFCFKNSFKPNHHMVQNIVDQLEVKCPNNVICKTKNLTYNELTTKHYK